MPQKRPLDETSSTQKAKKSKTNDTVKTTNSLPTEEVDFPRGGGTSFTPLEVKTIRAEAVKEANAELFEDVQHGAEKSKKRKRKAQAQASNVAEGKDRLRIEHLNYKRINVGMKIFGQVIAILPLALIISLPNQLFAHVPITNISTQFTELLERMESQEIETNLEGDDEEEEDKQSKPQVPELSDIFKVGQYVRAVVSAVHAPGASDTSGVGRSRDDTSRASKRVELCLIPERVNSGVQKSDLKAGFTLTAAVKSQEDHGYILDFGIPDISGFLSFKDPKNEDTKLHVGVLLDVTVTKVSGNGRTCTVSTDHATFTSSYLSEISSVSSILPGTLVQALVTTSHSTGLNLLVLGYFEGTVDQLHLRNEGPSYKIGKKIKARILYHYSSSSPPKFALALTEHVVNLRVRQSQDKYQEAKKTQNIQDAYPVGTLLEAVKVLRIEPERGLIVEVEPGLEGFVHISHASDDHIPSLSTNGYWKPGSIHPARVTGYFALDGLLQLSLKPSVIQQKYFQVNDVEVGEMIKGTVKKLTESALFVSLSGGIDGVVWPNHYADITLKHPAKRFQIGASIKCRVLVVDPDRKRVSLTAKKSLIDSSLPIFSKIEDFTSGMVTHAVVFKVYEKHLMVEFYNNLKAVVPAKEISDSPKSQLPESFPVGRVVRVRMLALHDGRITASIRQVTVNYVIASDISSIEIGHTVEGSVSEIHKDNAVLTLQPSHIRALLSLKNLANHRGLSLPQLRTGLKVGEKLEELVVVTRNAEKAFVIVANKPKPKPVALLKGSTITLESVKLGQLIGGRVIRHARHGVLVKITTHIGGILHITDTSDDFDTGISLPGIDTIIKATIIGIDKPKRQLTLSTRQSRLRPSPDQVIVDREISGIEDIQVGETLRGFIKNIGEHGLFITLGRNVDARVQIRELFDEYIKDWQGQFHANQLVKGHILGVDVSGKKVEMTFRSGDSLTRRESSSLFISDLKEGQKVEGIVKKIEDYGLFIQINGSKINGLCHKSQLSDNAEADVTIALRGFREGDRVKAIVLSIDKRRISLGLKPSYFTEEDLEDVNETSAEDPQTSNTLDLASDTSAKASVHDDDGEGSSDEENDDSMDVDLVLDEAQTEYHPTQTSSIPKLATPSSLPLSGGFHWSGNAASQNEDEEAYSSSDESDDAEKPSKKKRKRKEIEQDLTTGMHTKTPESNADFERLLLGSPNSSYLWIQYMSFQLPLSELNKAREIARRAIQTINFREEKEKLNVWIALLNLENVYGTEDSLQAVFKEAARANDSKTVHLRLASIFDQAEKLEQAEEQYKRTCKKFGPSSKVWTLFGEYHLRRGNVEEARKLLPRSLQSLEKRKHLKTISRFAQLEYKYGDPERGKTLFEGIIDAHSKRWDMWSVYMDMEATQGNIQALRNIFDRVLVLKMTSHKAKSFFKKWFELEKRIGDAEGAGTVKTKAIEWTQRASNAS